MDKIQPSRKIIGDCLKQLRENQNLTLQELSSRTKISISSLSRNENGQRDLLFYELVLLCSVLCIDSKSKPCMDWFIEKVDGYISDSHQTEPEHEIER